MQYFSSGDGPFFFLEQIRELSWLPNLFDQSVGFGFPTVIRLWIDYPFRLWVKILASMGLDWWMIDKICWIMVLLIGIISSYKLARLLLPKYFSVVSVILYLTNTYAVLLFSGGQLGVALAYSLSPLVLMKFIQNIDQSFEQRVTRYEIWKKGITSGLWLALIVCFDLRLAYLIFSAIVLYTLYCVWVSPKIYSTQLLVHVYILPLFITFLIHTFWILPVVFVHGAEGIGSELTSPGMLRFLSVADFSHALALLHPNWPENLFGKVYFLQPEFLALPLLAFGGLLWIGKARKTGDDTYGTWDNEQKTERVGQVTMSRGHERILFFAFLSILGVFLAKGSQEPFGNIFVWLFEHIPGFIMFRDPTKFYLFIAIGYSILIPFALIHCLRWITESKKRTKYICHLLVFIFLVYWIFTIRAVFVGLVGGNFRPKQLPNEYNILKNLIISDAQPYRTLWLPSGEKFAYSSPAHPILTGDSLWKNASIGALLTIISKKEFSEKISNAGVKYIIIPMDVEKRIFLTDYKFDPNLRNTLIQEMKGAGFQILENFGDLAVFINPVFEFKRSIPSYIKQQEYWSNIGIGISGSTLVFALGLLFFLRNKKHTL